MSGSDTLSVQLPSDGIKGLAMIAPVVGLPLLLHAVGGAVITGAGFVAVSSVMNPIAGIISRATKGLASVPQQSIAKPAPEFSVPITVTVADEVSAGDVECRPQAVEVII
jgi:hypothetical protein